MTEMLSSCRNYDNYRQAYNRCAGFKIPILGVHLKDLISVNEAMSDYVDEDKVNVQKLQALYGHINELIQLQLVPPVLDANKDLVHLLTVTAPASTRLFSEVFLPPFFGRLLEVLRTRRRTRRSMQMSAMQHEGCPRPRVGVMRVYDL